ncbi:phosphoglycerate dehydrogenase [Echinicola strongylocentroti]|uniref:Phosphoglycerate dehydrogenase n=1 Tax=Echinicola strongylocentroti TaxID=1795355 RepID=A0A2Z4IFU9_9BACT|nr:2-hydroxyacid dehydrogenase [Echinicola strongylocentroti]AWW29972.1 phosphoglycerate dehydrogenase [Echinicola strongylocentroti]
MNILIIDEMHTSITPLLEKAGFKVDYCPKITRKEIEERIAGYEGLIIRSKTPMDRALLEQAVKLKFIGRAGAGLDKIDMEYIDQKGIRLFHAPEGNRDAVGEHAIAMLLMLFNNLQKADSEVRRGIWDREGNRGEELQGKTVGVFGYGNMGKAFARRLNGFGVKVLAYDKYLENYSDEYAKEASFEEVQREADILSIHVPLTPETRNFFTEEVLSQFQKPFYLINTARGEVISLDVLNQALTQGVLKGALLDVLENEKLHTLTPAQKLSFERLTARDNVLFTPHIAGWTYQSYEKINNVLVEKISAEFP